MVFLVIRKAQETVEFWTVLCQFPYILKSYFCLKAIWFMSQLSSWLIFIKSQPSKLFKSCLFLFIEEKLSLQPKSNICNFRWKECCCQYVLLKITLLHLELKIFDYGGNGIYASINLEFASCVVNDKCILAEGNWDKPELSFNKPNNPSCSVVYNLKYITLKVA